VLSSSVADTVLVEEERRTDGGRRLGSGTAATAGADTGTGGTYGAFHDIPSRSANSVFTLANERRRRAHCAGVVISAARSSWCSAASFARRRAARARARGVVKSCWTGSNLRVGGIDAPRLAVDPEPEARTGGLGVASIEADFDSKVDIVNAAEGAKVISGDIS